MSKDPFDYDNFVEVEAGSTAEVEAGSTAEVEAVEEKARIINDVDEVKEKLQELEEKSHGVQQSDDEDTEVEAAREARKEALKARSDIRENRDAFLLEMAGISPFKKQYKVLGDLVKITFVTMTSEEMEQVRQQTSVDLTLNRVKSFHPIEVQQLAANYRMAASIESMQIHSPDGLIVKDYVKSVPVLPEDLADCRDALSEKDTPVYRRWLYVQKNLLTTQTLTRLVQEAFAEFEQLQLDMLELLRLDPSFFTEGSSQSGETD